MKSARGRLMKGVAGSTGRGGGGAVGQGASAGCRLGTAHSISPPSCVFLGKQITKNHWRGQTHPGCVQGVSALLNSYGKGLNYIVSR
jgi:hypothetical protein